MAEEEVKLQLQDLHQEAVEAKCLRQEVLEIRVCHHHLEVTLEVEVHQEEVVQEDSFKN